MNILSIILSIGLIGFAIYFTIKQVKKIIEIVKNKKNQNNLKGGSD